jgi:hypothetical protein
LCVQEASLRQLKALRPLRPLRPQRPHIEQVDFCSVAGSRYKSAQTILGLRDANDTSGEEAVLHFNASGELKRRETEGHNLIKRRYAREILAKYKQNKAVDTVCLLATRVIAFRYRNVLLVKLYKKPQAVFSSLTVNIVVW